MIQTVISSICLLFLISCSRPQDYREIADLSLSEKWDLSFTNTRVKSVFSVRIYTEGEIAGKVMLQAEGKEDMVLTGSFHQLIDMGDWYEDIYGVSIVNPERVKGKVRLSVTFESL